MGELDTTPCEEIINANSTLTERNKCLLVLLPGDK